MSAMANVTPIIATVKNAGVKEKTLKETDTVPKASILDFCEGRYEDILPIIMDRARNSPIRFHHERSRTRDREWHDDRNVFNRLSHRRKSVHERLSDIYSPSITKSGPNKASSRDPSHSGACSLSRDSHRIRDHLRGVEESYDDTYSSHGTETKYRDRSRGRDHSRSMKRWRTSESPPSRESKSSTSDKGHWKSRVKRGKPADEDLAVPWTCEDVDPFTPRIRNFKSSGKTRMPNNVKTYDGTGDPEDHLKIFQAAARVKRWAMPTWCHMFNSTLIGAARVWFDELPPESIDGVHGLKGSFQHTSCQQKKRRLLDGGDAEHYTKAWMNFMIVRSPSPYNGIIGRPGIREIQAVPSTTHRMLKFLVNGRIVTIRSTILTPTECVTIAATPKETAKKAKARHENLKVDIHPDFPDQEITIGGTVSTKAQTELCTLLKGNLDISVWKPFDMTGVPRSIAEHRLDIRKGYSPIRQKKRGQAPERAKVIQVEVQKLVEVGILHEVYYHDWLSNPVMVRKHDGNWRMCVDFTDLNKACPQDCYPLPEIDWKIESLYGYPFKCFLDAYKGYHQIQMAEEDEEKTAFHTSRGVYCYTKMPFSLKNAGATYQRQVDKAFDKQIGRNLEIYVDDLVIKSDTETEMLRDIE
ncbi:reverse transcriptase domain-containing protein [Tanacetum coccineum]